MTETKPKWEEEIYKVGVPHIGFPLDSEANTCIKVIDALIPFIRKVRTDAVLEERKRIEEGVNKLLPPPSEGYCLDHLKYDQVLQIINN